MAKAQASRMQQGKMSTNDCEWIKYIEKYNTTRNLIREIIFLNLLWIYLFLTKAEPIIPRISLGHLF